MSVEDYYQGQLDLINDLDKIFLDIYLESSENDRSIHYFFIKVKSTMAREWWRAQSIRFKDVKEIY